MKTIFIIFAFCLSTNTFAQQLKKEVEKCPLLIELKYQNDGSLFSNTTNLKSDLYSQIISVKAIETFPKNDFKVANKNFAFSKTLQMDLSKELRSIMHKFPGDGNNLHIDARGMKH